jgi:hypothetical protein
MLNHEFQRIDPDRSPMHTEKVKIDTGFEFDFAPA